MRETTRDIHWLQSRSSFSTLDQMNKVKTKDSKGFSGRNRKFKQFFRPKKRSSFQKRHEIRCQYTKNTNLGLDLHSSSPEPVNFFGAQSSLEGHNFCLGGTTSHLGEHGHGMPPRGAGSVLY